MAHNKTAQCRAIIRRMRRHYRKSCLLAKGSQSAYQRHDRLYWQARSALFFVAALETKP